MCWATPSISTFPVVPWVGSSRESVDRLRKGPRRQIDPLASKPWSLEPGAQVEIERAERREDRPTRGQAGRRGLQVAQR